MSIFIAPAEAVRRINDYVKRQAAFLFVVNYATDQSLVLSPTEAAEAGIFFRIGQKTNRPAQEIVLPDPIIFKKTPCTLAEYRPAFDKIQAHLQAGNSYLTNLTFPTSVETNLSLAQIYERAEAPFKLLFQDKFTVFSPEIFIQIRGQEISCHPMKGTIPADIPDARRRILDDPKEFAEHATITDLIRNDLSIRLKNVRVKRFRYLSRLRNREKDLLQVSSEITADLDAENRENLGELLFSLLPAGSVTGAPKAKTLEIIGEAETEDRGFYTGVFGYFDGRDMDSAVMIRFLEKTATGMVYRSGGGITAQSRCEDEYQELMDKVYLPWS